MTYKYYFLNRPPMYGTLPKGFTKYEQWIPARTVPDFLTRHAFLGYAEYPAPLTFEQVWQWELIPADGKTLIEYYFYREYDRSQKDGMRAMMEYVNLSKDELGRLSQDGDFLCTLALEYKLNFMPKPESRWLLQKPTQKELTGAK